MRRLPVLFSLLLMATALAGHSTAQDNQTCFECHSDSSLTTVDSTGKEISLYVDSTAFFHSVHGSFNCIDCHTDIEEIPHPEDLAKVDCGMCHADEAEGCKRGIHGRLHQAGDLDAPYCADCHGYHDVRAVSDPESRVHPLNQPSTCAKCHADPEFARRRNLPSALPPVAYEQSVHARALRRGVSNAPTCSDCHTLENRAHVILEMSDPASPVHYTNVAKTCGRCHEQTANVYIQSAHGAALAKGIREAPTCNFCHGEHRILTPQEPGSPANPERVSETICSPCHASEVLSEKFGLPPDRVSTYESSYHGLAVRRGSKVAANCTSCHGVHDIFPASDPRSRVHPANLEKTCGTCHPGAGEKFAKIKIHSYRSSTEFKVAEIIRKLYILLIVMVIGGMFLHNFIVWLFYVVNKYRRTKEEPGVRRFTRTMVTQHLLLLTSFITLVITGFALKFPDAFAFRLLFKLGLTEELRGLLHRIAASVMIATALYHLFWLFFTRHGRREIVELLPNLRDVEDFLSTVQYYLRLSKERPQYSKYNYAEKVEYWALVWGTVVMVVTGLTLWFPEQATELFGPWVVPIAEIIHYYEAMLATLAIVVWHFYWVIFHPEEYPMSFVWLHGKMPYEEAIRHRADWLAKEASEEELPPQEQDS